jgi:hypothetical protein
VNRESRIEQEYEVREFTVWAEYQDGALGEIGNGTGTVPVIGDEFRLVTEPEPLVLQVHRRVFDADQAQWHVYVRRSIVPMPEHEWDAHRHDGPGLFIEVPDPPEPRH